jgi:hypothetical protein
MSGTTEPEEEITDVRGTSTTLKELERIAETWVNSKSMAKAPLLDIRLRRVEFEIKLEEIKGNSSNTTLPR